MLSSQSVGFVAHFARAYPWRTATMVCLLMLAGLAEGLGIATLLPLLDSLGDQGNAGDIVSETLVRFGIEPTLLILLGIIVLAISLKGALRWLAMLHVGQTIARVGFDLRRRLLRALMAVRWSYFTRQPSGFFANAVSTESLRSSQAYKAACSALAGLIQLLVYAAVIVAISWRFAFFVVLVGGLVAVLLGTFVRIGRAAGREQTRSMQSLVRRLNDALQGIKSIKAMGREQLFLPVLESDASELQKAEKRQVIAKESLTSFQEPIIVLIIAVGLYVSLTWAEMPFSSVLVLAFLFHRTAGRIHYVQAEYQGMAIGESAFWSLHSLSALAEQEGEGTGGTRRPPQLEQQLGLEGVTFAYGDTPVLEDISFRIPAGSFAALVGPSGAGKTTVVDLVVGLQRPQGGRVLVDGVPLDEIDLRQWRQLVGYVAQETLLFHDTLYSNVTLSDDSVSRDAVERALRLAEAWDFVERLPSGMDTVLGERGARISGGERQRIAIARALLRGPRLLVLDEATTALDPETEASICETLTHLKGRITILAISHQAAMRGVADLVFEIRGGRIQAIPGPELEVVGSGDRGQVRLD